MKEYDASVAATRAPLSQYPEVADILRFATLAANGHNTQPWRFRIGEDRIEILPDLARRTPVVDPDDHHLFVNLLARRGGLKTADLPADGTACD